MRSSPIFFLVSILIVATFNYLDRSIIGILQEPIKKEFGLSDFQLGLLGGPAFALLYIIMGLPFGRLAERVNRVRLISITFAFWSAMTALCGMAGSYVVLLAARAGVSIGEAGASPSAHSLIADRFPPEKRAGALAVYTSGISFGSLMAALAGGSIAQALGWRASFFALGIAGFLCAIAFWLLIPEAPRGTRREDTPSFGQAMREFASRRDLWHVALAVTAGATLSLSTVQYLTSYFIRAHHLNIGEAVLHVALIAGVAGAIGTYCGGFLGNYLSKCNPGAPAAAVARAYMVAPPVFVAGILVPDPTLSTILLMISTAANSSYFGPSFAAMHDTVSPRMRATGVAIILLVSNLIGYGFGPPLVGALSDYFGREIASGSGFSQQICAAGPWLQQSCASPQAGGLQWALCLVVIVNFWGIYHLRKIAWHRGSPSATARAAAVSAPSSAEQPPAG